jgi:FkbM family methyltransferase
MHELSKTDIVKFSEHITFSFFLRCQNIVQSGDFIDVGANVGILSSQFGLLICNQNDSNLIVFEPNTALHETIASNLQSQQITNYCIENYAVSNVNVNHEFFISLNDSQTSSLFQIGGESKKIEVETVTLDHYIKYKNSVPKFIKIDAEGSDHDVLYGMDRTLEVHRPFISAELSPWTLDLSEWERIFKFLKSKDYSIFSYDGLNYDIDNWVFEKIAKDNPDSTFWNKFIIPNEFIHNFDSFFSTNLSLFLQQISSNHLLETRRDEEVILNRKVLALIDGLDIVSIQDGLAPYSKLSHNNLLFDVLQSHLDQGDQCFIYAVPEDCLISIEQIYPKQKINFRITDYVASENLIEFDLGYSVYLTWAKRIKNLSNKAVAIVIQPASHWLENAKLYDKSWIPELYENSSHHLDYVICLNNSVKENVSSLLNLLTPFPEDRILVYNNFKKHDNFQINGNRQKLGFSNEDVIMINTGGVWDWTDTCNFIEFLCKYLIDNPNSRLKFIQMGIRQNLNIDHEASFKRISLLRHRYKGLEDVGKIKYFSSWDDASENLVDYLTIADIGISVSKFSPESHQAFRQRVLDYLSFDLFVLSSRGDYYDYLNPKNFKFCRPGVEESYLNFFINIEDNFKEYFTKDNNSKKDLQDFFKDHNFEKLVSSSKDFTAIDHLRRSAMILSLRNTIDIFTGLFSVAKSDLTEFRILSLMRILFKRIMKKVRLID